MGQKCHPLHQPVQFIACAGYVRIRTSALSPAMHLGPRSLPQSHSLHQPISLSILTTTTASLLPSHSSNIQQLLPVTLMNSISDPPSTRTISILAAQHLSETQAIPFLQLQALPVPHQPGRPLSLLNSAHARSDLVCDACANAGFYG